MTPDLIKRLRQSAERQSAVRPNLSDLLLEAADQLERRGREGWDEEAVARIIDPFAFEHGGSIARRVALTKARAILALSGSSGGVPEGWRESLAALEVAKTLMMSSGWWTNEAGYLTDAALWIDRAMISAAPSFSSRENPDHQEPLRGPLPSTPHGSGTE